MEKNEYGRRVWDVEAAAAAVDAGSGKRRKGGDDVDGGNSAWFKCKECGERFKDTLALARHSGRHRKESGGEEGGDEGSGGEGKITLDRVQAFVKSL